MPLARTLLSLGLSLLVVQPVLAAEGDIIPGASVNVNAKTWWVNCKSIEIKDNCIESIEILDDANQQWVPAVEEKSPYWKPGLDLPLRENVQG